MLYTFIDQCLYIFWVSHEYVCTRQQLCTGLGVQYSNQSSVATQLPSETLSWSEHFYSLLSLSPGHSQLAVTDEFWVQHLSLKYRQPPPCLALGPLCSLKHGIREWENCPGLPLTKYRKPKWCSLASYFLDLKTNCLSHCSYQLLSCPVTLLALLLIRCNTIITQQCVTCHM